MPFVRFLGRMEISHPVSTKNKALEFLSNMNSKFCGRFLKQTGEVFLILNFQILLHFESLVITLSLVFSLVLVGERFGLLCINLDLFLNLLK